MRLSPEVARFDQMTPQALLASAATLGLPEKLALRTVQDVVKRVLVAFDALYTEHDPQQGGLMAQLNTKNFKVPDFDAMDEPTTPGSDNAGAQVSASEPAQQLKLLRVLRHIVLPEMVPRVLASWSKST